LSGQVRFTGRVNDPLPYYAAADFYVHPTYYDPCSLVVLEAAACGLPLITSRYNGASEIFREGQDVLLVDDPADDAELAGAMRILLDDSARRRLGAAARATVLPHSLKRNVDRILEIYREILDRRDGLPHGYKVLQARISGAAPRRDHADRDHGYMVPDAVPDMVPDGARPPGSRALDMHEAGVKK
jgi:hypothetical protein